ncbi:hypothetical protein ACF3NT_11940 [Naumannella halotolerans]|nr:hypothetical protein [Naumannella halotolerans]
MGEEVLAQFVSATVGISRMPCGGGYGPGAGGALIDGRGSLGAGS